MSRPSFPSIPIRTTSRSAPLYPLSPQLPSDDDADSDEEYSQWGTSSRSHYSLHHSSLLQPPSQSSTTNLNALFFNSPTGYSLYILLLLTLFALSSVDVTIFKRLIIWSDYLVENYTEHTNIFPLLSGVYNFPYPVLATFIQLVLTHAFLVLWARISRSRMIGGWLMREGLQGCIAPSFSNIQDIKGSGKSPGVSKEIGRWTSLSSDGIAGGGIFEFDSKIASQVLPLSLIFVSKIFFGNLAFQSSKLSIYYLCRIGIIPLSLLLTKLITHEHHSLFVISSCITATLALFLAAMPSSSSLEITYSHLFLGFISSVFTVLYPILVPRAYSSLLTSLTTSSRLPLTPQQSSLTYHRLLHYTSLLSLLLYTPILILSSELPLLYHSLTTFPLSHTVSPYFHLLPLIFSSLFNAVLFSTTIALTRATSPLTTTFLYIPCAAFLLPLMARFRLDVHQWIAVGLCGACSLWFCWVRRREGVVLRGLK